MVRDGGERNGLKTDFRQTCIHSGFPWRRNKALPLEWASSKRWALNLSPKKRDELRSGARRRRGGGGGRSP